MKDENTPEFENRDHAIIWENIRENTAAIEELRMRAREWIRWALKRSLISHIITTISLVITIIIAVITLST